MLFTLATSTLESWDDALIAVASMETGEHRIILQGGSHARYSPTGHLLYVNRGTLHAVGFDLETLEVKGQPVPIVEEAMTSWSGGVGEFALSENGTLVYAPGRSQMGNRRVVRMFLGGRGNEELASFSPNGRFLAYRSDETGQLEIYVCRFPDGSGKQQVSTDGGYEPVWNPNGKELFYRSGDKMMAVSAQTEGNLVLGRPTPLFEGRFFYHSAGSYDVTPDGQHFVLIDDSVAERPPTHLVLVQNFSEVLKRLLPTRN